MSETKEIAEKALEALQAAVFEALDRKRRLGQYAVIVENGKTLEIGPNEIERRIAPLRAKYGNSAEAGSKEELPFVVRESKATNEGDGNASPT